MANVAHLRRLNFGVRALTTPVSAAALTTEIPGYDPDDAMAVSAWMRREASLERAVVEWEELYRDVRTEWSGLGPVGVSAEGRAAAAYLRSISDVFKGSADLRRLYHGLGEEHHRTVMALRALENRESLPPDSSRRPPPIRFLARCWPKWTRRPRSG